jgi:hypothetical protein
VNHSSTARLAGSGRAMVNFCRILAGHLTRSRFAGTFTDTRPSAAVKPLKIQHILAVAMVALRQFLPAQRAPDARPALGVRKTPRARQTRSVWTAFASAPLSAQPRRPSALRSSNFKSRSSGRPNPNSPAAPRCSAATIPDSRPENPGCNSAPGFPGAATRTARSIPPSSRCCAAPAGPTSH